MKRPAAVYLFFILSASVIGFGQARQGAAEADTLKLEREKFEFEKKQSTRAIVFGFILTTIGGAYVTWLLSTRSWPRQTRIDLFRKRYDEGTVFLDDFSRAVGRRFFLMQRLLWAMGGPDPERIQRLEREYFEAVTAWNASYWVYRNKIRLLVDDAYANAFLDYQDDFRGEHPQSLHYLFVKAHREVQKANTGELSKDDAQSAVDNLNWACSSFLENLTTSFLNRATSLQLLRVPSQQSSSLRTALEGRHNLTVPPRFWEGALHAPPKSAKTTADAEGSQS
jgi:hypothetical protein